MENLPPFAGSPATATFPGLQNPNFSSNTTFCHPRNRYHCYHAPCGHGTAACSNRMEPNLGGGLQHGG